MPSLAGVTPNRDVVSHTLRSQATATCVRGTAVADLVAVAGSLDPVMGDVDR